MRVKFGPPGQPALVAKLLLLLFTLMSASNSFAARPFEMAATAVQLIPLSDEPYRNGTVDNPLSSLAPDVDVITLYPEHLGIPFDEFAAGSNISSTHPWTVKMLQLAADAAATGKPLMVELGFIRSGLVDRAEDNNGELQIIPNWAPVCYDFTQPGALELGDAYVNYATWMANTFAPKYMVNFIEANLYYSDCGGDTASWNALVAIQNAAHDAIKAAQPQTRVFPSIYLEALYDKQLDGWNSDHFDAITQLSRDLIGISSYPFGLTNADGSLVTPYDLPPDYIVRIKLRHPEESLAVAETGWNSSNINIGDPDFCLYDFPYSQESWVRDYMQFVFASAHFGEFEIVNWFAMADPVGVGVLDTCYVRSSDPYLECEGDPWCTVMNYMKDNTWQGGSELFSELLIKVFGGLGMKYYDGTEKPLVIEAWRNELANTE